MYIQTIYTYLQIFIYYNQKLCSTALNIYTKYLEHLLLRTLGFKRKTRAKNFLPKITCATYIGLTFYKRFFQFFAFCLFYNGIKPQVDIFRNYRGWLVTLLFQKWF